MSKGHKGQIRGDNNNMGMLDFGANAQSIVPISVLPFHMLAHGTVTNNEDTKYTSLGYVKNGKKANILYLHIREAIQLVTLKLHWGTYVR